jgi:hypothetical protein
MEEAGDSVDDGVYTKWRLGLTANRGGVEMRQ